VNILVTTPTFHPYRGGAESLLEDLLERFVKAGHRVIVVTRLSNDSKSAEDYRGMQVRRLLYPTNRLNQWIRSFSILRQLWLIIRAERIQVVCLGLVGPESVFVALIHYFLKFKLVLFLHGSELRSYVKISRPVRWALKRALRCCTTAIAVSHALKEEAIEFQPSAKEKIFVVPCGIDVEKIRSQTAEAPVEKNILFVGRFHQVKDVPTLLRGFRIAAAEIPELKLFLAGSGPEEAALRTMVSEFKLLDRIRFLGSVDRSEVFRLIRQCEFLVVSSTSEGCPVVVLEALAAGKVVLASRSPGNIEILRDRENGIFFEPGNSEDLARKLLELCGNRALVTQIETRIRETDLSAYEIQSVVRRHAELYLFPKEQLRICLISASYYQDENCGGISSYYYYLNTALTRLGHATHLITSAGDDRTKVGNEIYVNPAWSKMISFSHGMGSLKRLILRFIFSYRAYRAARRLDREKGLDIILAPELFAQGFFISLFLRQKLVTGIHAPTEVVDPFNASYRMRVLSHVLSLPEKFQAERSAHVTVATEFLSKQIQSTWGISSKRIQILPNGIDIAWIRNLGMSNIQRIQSPYLLYFGRLERLKGVEILSEALRTVFASVPDVKMIWIGRNWGSQSRIVSELAEYHNRMEIHDTMNKERLFPFVFNSTLVILPSLFENFSNAGLESMALERVVIATRNTGFSEMIEDEVNGFLVEPGDPVALSRKIIACLKRRDLDEIGKKAYETVMQFDSTKVAHQNVEFFNKVLGAL
jgi:glycosyltransferase involved in cell wall biosynthesis